MKMEVVVSMWLEMLDKNVSQKLECEKAIGVGQAFRTNTINMGQINEYNI